MQTVVTLLEKKIPEFNERSLTVADFWKLAEKEDIAVIEKLLPVRSFLMTLGGISTICISSNLSRAAWLESAWHEMTHYYCHGQESLYSILYHSRSPTFENKIELEAEAGALIALIPRADLAQSSIDMECDDYDYWDIMTRRRKLFQIYGV